MNNFWYVTASNQPCLRDPTRVQQIIAKYWFDFDCNVEVEPDSAGRQRLSMQGDGWPAAWLLPADTSSEEYYPDHVTPGQEEFAACLAEIAPFLMETLVVQAIGSSDGQFPLSACEWQVSPGSTAVAKIEFTSFAESEAPLALASA